MYRRFADHFLLNLIIVQYEQISVQNMMLIYIVTGGHPLASMAQLGVRQCSRYFCIIYLSFYLFFAKGNVSSKPKRSSQVFSDGFLAKSYNVSNSTTCSTRIASCSPVF